VVLLAGLWSLACAAPSLATPGTTHLTLTPGVHSLTARWAATETTHLIGWRVRWRVLGTTTWTVLKPDLAAGVREYTITSLEAKPYQVTVFARYEVEGKKQLGGPETATGTPLAEAEKEPPPPPSGFVTACGVQLCLNGSAFRFDGGNVDPICSPGQGLEAALTEYHGVEAIRVWWFQPFATTNGVRNWTPLDNTLAIAAAHNVKVLVTLENQWKNCIATGYKTRSWYESGYESTQGGELVSYRQWVREVATRYKSNSTLLAYQLVNEAEDANSRGGTCEETRATSALRTFTDDVGRLIHSIDPYHLVDLGTLGSGQCGTKGSDYRYVHESVGTNMCGYHDYGAPSTPMPGDSTDGLKVRLEQCGALKKPLMVDETGIQTSSSISYEQRASDFSNKLTAQFTAGVVGELFWQLDDVDTPQFGTFDIGPSDPSAALLTKF